MSLEQTTSVPLCRRSSICHSYKILGHCTYHHRCYQRLKKTNFVNAYINQHMRVNALSLIDKADWWSGYSLESSKLVKRKLYFFYTWNHWVCSLFHKTLCAKRSFSDFILLVFLFSAYLFCSYTLDVQIKLIPGAPFPFFLRSTWTVFACPKMRIKGDEIA